MNCRSLAPRTTGLDRNVRSQLQFEGRKRSEQNSCTRDRIIAIGSIAAPIANADHEQLDRAVGAGFPSAKDIKYPLLRFLVFEGEPCATLVGMRSCISCRLPCFAASLIGSCNMPQLVHQLA